MKNTIKLRVIQRIAGIIALVAIFGFSVISCNNGSTGGGGKTNTGGDNNTGSGDLFDKDKPLLFYRDLVGSSCVTICFNGDGYVYSDALSSGIFKDFTLTIDGKQIEVTGGGMVDSGWGLTIGRHNYNDPLYTFGNTYKIKVVYTANPARGLYHLNAYTGIEQLVPSFSIERDLEYIDRNSLMSTRTITGHATVAANKIP